MRLPNLVLSTILIVAQAPVHAQAPADLDALLTLPPTPAVEALLLAHVADPRVPTRWREALGDASASRRAAAARMVGIAGVRSALGGLMHAVKTERDPVALGEVLRALAIVGSEHADPAIFARLSDTHGLPEARIATVLTTLRPESVVTHVLAGGKLAQTRARVSEIHALLLVVSPEQAARLEQTLTSSPGLPMALHGVLQVASTTAHRVSVDLLMAGLREGAATAGEVLAYLPAVYGTPGTAAADVALVQAFTHLRETLPEPTDNVHRTLLVMVDRWLGRPTRPSIARDLSEWPVVAYRSLSLPNTALRVLSADERQAVAARLELTGEPRDALLKAAGGERASPRMWDLASKTPAHLMSDLPGSLVADLRRLTGCRASIDDAQAAIVTFKADGRPLAVTLGQPSLSTECQRFLQTLVSIAYGPPPTTGTEPARVVIRLDEDWVTCLASGEEAARDARPVPLIGGSMTPPRKVTDRKPTYPPGALEARVEGVVVLEATISTTGCVSDVRVTRSIRTLDLAAIHAASIWRYSPAMIDGQAVPVLMTVTVNFTL